MSSKILYGCVAMDGQVVCEFPSGNKHIKDNARFILSKLARQDYQDTLKHEDTVYFFIQSRSGLTVLGVTTVNYPLFSTQKFVRSLKTQWQRGTGKDKKVIQKEIEQWNRVDNENNPLLKIQNDTVVVKEKMMKNIDHIIENLEKLDTIETKSEDLAKNAGSLQKKNKYF